MSTKRLTMVESLNLALFEEMRRDPNVLVLGEDVGVNGGVFRVTKDLIKEFGADRSVDTPLAEEAIIGASFGLAVYGKRPVCEIQFDGFIFEGFDQIESHMRRIRMRSRGSFTCPMVLRAPCGGGIRALEHHNESAEMLYCHIPGVVVVMPSGPRNARALLKASIRSNDPVIFFEPKAIYRSIREDIPVDHDEVAPLGKAHIARPGSQFTVITYGPMLKVTMDALKKRIEEKNWDPEVIDLLTLSPLDNETILESVKKTGRVVIVHEAPRTGGIAAEIIARINEFAFFNLQAPIERVTGWDTPYPFFARELTYIPDAPRIMNAIENVLKY
ncbi:MAG: alpha-ketoacid dehydrogenase subunit beta [Deltaproteobacteria bacterium]|nr:alpha-ketoacid dehydrogenase subunit beta [Deltaproteobacteria bacterium]